MVKAKPNPAALPARKSLSGPNCDLCHDILSRALFSVVDASPSWVDVPLPLGRMRLYRGGMGLNIQIVIDCRRPHQLADWWAETLEWSVEPQDAGFIRSMIEQGFATEDQTTTHRGNLVWKDGAAIRPPEEIDTKAPS